MLLAGPFGSRPVAGTVWDWDWDMCEWGLSCLASRWGTAPAGGGLWALAWSRFCSALVCCVLCVWSGRRLRLFWRCLVRSGGPFPGWSGGVGSGFWAGLGGGCSWPWPLGFPVRCLAGAPGPGGGTGCRPGGRRSVGSGGWGRPDGTWCRRSAGSARFRPCSAGVPCAPVLLSFWAGALLLCVFPGPCLPVRCSPEHQAGDWDWWVVLGMGCGVCVAAGPGTGFFFGTPRLVCLLACVSSADCCPTSALVCGPVSLGWDTTRFSRCDCWTVGLASAVGSPRDS